MLTLHNCKLQSTNCKLNQWMQIFLFGILILEKKVYLLRILTLYT